jgi:hypothetical protein
MDSGPEKIEDEQVLRVLRRQARKVYLESVLTAAALTALCLLAPAG